MGRKTFENYGKIAKAKISNTVVAGRYSMQEKAEKLIVPDVCRKLNINGNDDLLEIGCGTGNLLVPLSLLVKAASGIDHPSVLNRFKEDNPNPNINLIPGNFLDIDLSKDHGFSKILIYSVIQCLSDLDEAIVFCKKALSCLSPKGKMLIGDVPNVDLKQRFLSSEEGKKFQLEWSASFDRKSEMSKLPKLSQDSDVFLPNDKTMLELMSALKTENTKILVLPQPRDLPFGNTRQDILVESF